MDMCRGSRDLRIFRNQQLDCMTRMLRFDDAETSRIRDFHHLDRNSLGGKAHEFGPDPKLYMLFPASLAFHCFHGVLTNECLARLYLAGKDIHAGRTDEMPDERMARALEQFYRRADLHDQAIFHDDHLFRERSALPSGHE